MIAVKGNRSYQISAAEQAARQAAGYDIYDDEGKIIAYSKLKTVPYEQYAALSEELEKCKAENKALKKELKELKKE